MSKYVIKTDKAKSDGLPCYFYGYCGKLNQTAIGVKELEYARKFNELGDACVHLDHITMRRLKAFAFEFDIVRVSKGTDGEWHEREVIDLMDEKYRL